MRDYLSQSTVRRSLTAACLVAILIHAIVVLYVREPHVRDFDLHRLMGTWFLNGQSIYGCGVCYPYMPTAAMYFALLAMVSRTVGFAVRYGAALLCLWLTFTWLHRMITDRFPELRGTNLALSIMTVVLAGQFVLYDLDDGGPHLILLGMMVGGMYAVWQGREKAAALWFGLAIALKITPGLLLPFFLWKRQWRLASYTAVSATMWILLPIVWMGPAAWWTDQMTWTRVAVGSALGGQTVYTEMNEANSRNSGLSAALTRYLVTLPPDHPLRRSDPGYVPVFDVPPVQARIVIAAAVGVLLLCFGWQTRQTYAGPRDPDWVKECSAVILLMLFLSPLTWIQHLPWLIPALYWVAAKALSREGLSRAGHAALALYVLLTVVLNYEVLGKRTYTVFLSFKPFTMAMLLLFFLLMDNWRTSPALPYCASVPVPNAK